MQMEVESEDQGRKTTKRLLVNLDGAEVPDPKRSKAEPNLIVKLNAIKLLLHWHEYLVKVYEVEGVEKIDTIADLTSILWTAHTKFRQDANRAGGLSTKITDDFEFSANNRTKKWKELKEPLMKLAHLYGFRYETTNTGRALTGTLGSILALIDTFRPRLNEIRVGTTKITLTKRDNSLCQTTIGTFGLAAEHAILMTGCTFNPTLQSSMKMSLGCMTIAINLCQQQDKRYQDE